MTEVAVLAIVQIDRHHLVAAHQLGILHLLQTGQDQSAEVEGAEAFDEAEVGTSTFWSRAPPVLRLERAQAPPYQRTVQVGLKDRHQIVPGIRQDGQVGLAELVQDRKRPQDHPGELQLAPLEGQGCFFRRADPMPVVTCPARQPEPAQQSGLGLGDQGREAARHRLLFGFFQDQAPELNLEGAGHRHHGVHGGIDRLRTAAEVL